MSLEVIYVARHGFRSQWMVDPSTGTYTSPIRSPTGLATDPALTSHGVDQANELAAHLLGVNPPIDQIYSSPYYRCIQTIQPFIRNFRRAQMQSSGNVSEEPPPKIRVDFGLSEWYGLAHFEHPSSAPLNELQAFFPELDASYGSSSAPSRHGESLPQLHDRVARVIDTIIRRTDQEGHRAILVSTHAAVVIALGRVLTGQMDHDFSAFTCGLSMYKRRGSSTTQASANSADKTGANAMIPTARDKGRIEVPRSKSHLDIDSASDVDLHPHDSKWSDLGSPRRDKSGLYGGWTCVKDSDCSFLRSGEERGWKFSGDESFIEEDDNGVWPSTVASRASTAVNKAGIERRSSSHNNPVLGNSKL
ncbi:phosphoglycerate mutase-like protein [Hypoxylon trugodes]|uniref:phosphoglycerate mutase-like protein n=1 Tax=Hypoxylon trugodes TaxID=326681 RepID=UPI00219ACA8C|nr:phosphoglycerate mutase-like protein [Hypoxylon trugodes]KAI1384593.1 phosphoglycerate mutase-like protein [Hypoxylon trugodes]